MFVRRTTIKSRETGEPYVTYRLVESVRTGESVRQVTVLNLGRRFEVPRPQWRPLAQRIEALVCIAGHDRPGLERLLPTPRREEVVPGAAPRAPGMLSIPGQKPRLEQQPSCCARPPFALQRIEQVNEDRIVYRLPEPQRDGRTARLRPWRRPALFRKRRSPASKVHWTFARGSPHAPLRLAAIAYGRDADFGGAPPTAKAPAAPAAAATKAHPSAHYLWAMLLARLFASLPLVCPNCGADMRIRAFVTETAPVECAT